MSGEWSDKNVGTEVSRVALLYELSRAFNELIELDELIPKVIAKTNELLQAEGTAVLLLHAQAGELYVAYSADTVPEVEGRLGTVRFPADRGIAGWVLQHGIAQLIPDVSQDERWYSHVDKQSGVTTRSLLCAPLRTRRGALG